MAQQVSVGKAAHILGISRHELQRLIRSGVLQAFEGQVDLDALKQCYPALGMQESAIVERVQLIRSSAFARRVRETVMPDQDELENRLRRRNAEWAIEHSRAQKYRTLLEELAQRLAEIQGRCEPASRAPLLELNGWLVERLKE